MSAYLFQLQAVYPPDPAGSAAPMVGDVFADGVEFDDGVVVVRGRRPHPGPTAVWSSMAELVDSHQGRTRVVWVASDPHAE